MAQALTHRAEKSANLLRIRQSMIRAQEKRHYIHRCKLIRTRDNFGLHWSQCKIERVRSVRESGWLVHAHWWGSAERQVVHHHATRSRAIYSAKRRQPEMAVQKTVQTHDLTEPEGWDSAKAGQIPIAPPFASARLQQSLPNFKANPLEAF